jgi:uncharacterized RDD family membrane protein YckC
MQPDGSIDYRGYTASELREALALIDRAKYPLNLQKLTAEIAARPPPAPAVAGRVMGGAAVQSTVSPWRRYQAFWRRLGARMVDGIVLCPLNWLAVSVQADQWSAPILVLWYVLLHSVTLAYNLYFLSRYGATLGKMLTGVKVMDVAEARLPSLREAFMRDIGLVVINVWALCYLTLLVATDRYVSYPDLIQQLGMPFAWTVFAWGALEVITMVASPKRRALHDYIAGTVVVRKA